MIVAKFRRYLSWIVSCTSLLLLKYSSILPWLDCTIGSGPRIRFSLAMCLKRERSSLVSWTLLPNKIPLHSPPSVPDSFLLQLPWAGPTTSFLLFLLLQPLGPWASCTYSIPHSTHSWPGDRDGEPIWIIRI